MSHFPYALKEITKNRRKETHKRYCDYFPLCSPEKLYNLILLENNLNLKHSMLGGYTMFVYTFCEIKSSNSIADLKQVTLSLRAQFFSSKSLYFVLDIFIT